jgi:transposase
VDCDHGSRAHSGHGFYDRLSAVLAESKFDATVEDLCRPFYIEGKGRPSIPPSVYMRMLLVGSFERLDSERGIAWRCADSLSLRQFLASTELSRRRSIRACRPPLRPSGV